MKKMKYKEKIDAACALYTIMEHYDDIKHKLFSGIYDVTIIVLFQQFFLVSFRNFEMQISVQRRIIRNFSKYQNGKQQKGSASIIKNDHTDPF